MTWTRARARDHDRRMQPAGLAAHVGHLRACCCWRPCSCTWIARRSAQQKTEITDLAAPQQQGLRPARAGIRPGLCGGRDRHGAHGRPDQPAMALPGRPPGLVGASASRPAGSPATGELLRLPGACWVSSRPGTGPAPGDLAAPALAPRPAAGQQHPPERRLAGRDRDADRRACSWPATRPRAGGCRSASSARSASSGSSPGWPTIRSTDLELKPADVPAPAPDDEVHRVDRLPGARHGADRFLTRPPVPGPGDRGDRDQPGAGSTSGPGCPGCSASNTATARASPVFLDRLLRGRGRGLPLGRVSWSAGWRAGACRSTGPGWRLRWSARCSRP